MVINKTKYYNNKTVASLKLLQVCSHCHYTYEEQVDTKTSNKEILKGTYPFLEYVPDHTIYDPYDNSQHTIKFYICPACGIIQMDPTLVKD